MAKACGNPECGTSTGICGSLTHGSGELDDYGYWEFPCRICAEQCDKQNVLDYPKQVEALIKDGLTPQAAEREVKESESYNWLTQPAWPGENNGESTSDH